MDFGNQNKIALKSPYLFQCQDAALQVFRFYLEVKTPHSKEGGRMFSYKAILSLYLAGVVPTTFLKEE